MVEIIGDVVVPIELILPKKEGGYIGKTGSLFLSGNKLWFHNGTSATLVTSA